MIVYNVTIKIDNSIVQAYLQWLQVEHIPELVSTGLFTGHNIYRLLEQDESEGPTYIVQYFLQNMADYETYIGEHAPRLREKSYKQFGNKFIAFRTLMETI